MFHQKHWPTVLAGVLCNVDFSLNVYLPPHSFYKCKEEDSFKHFPVDTRMERKKKFVAQCFIIPDMNAKSCLKCEFFGTAKWI